MELFEYSENFKRRVLDLLRGKEAWPHYDDYVEAHLGGHQSRYIKFLTELVPEIECRCGPLDKKRVLDFGCGAGSTTAALANRCKELSAFDIDEESLSICEARLREHGYESLVSIYCEDDIGAVKDSLGKFDLILLNAVLEHIPLSKKGLRERIVRTLFGLLSEGGYLFINETPNRLWPIDHHSTQLWWVPWTKPGSAWAYQRAVRKGRHQDVPTVSKGSLGLEEIGAWGATYWEIKKYIREDQFVCTNISKEFGRHLYCSQSGTWKRALFEFVAYYLGTKLMRAPITAFGSTLRNLVFQRV